MGLSLMHSHAETTELTKPPDYLVSQQYYLFSYLLRVEVKC